MKSRVERVRADDNKDPRRIVLQQDQDRAKLIKVHFHQDITDPLLYDFICNTDRLSFETISRMIVGLIKVRIKSSGRVQ